MIELKAEINVCGYAYLMGVKVEDSKECPLRFGCFCKATDNKLMVCNYFCEIKLPVARTENSH